METTGGCLHFPVIAPRPNLGEIASSVGLTLPREADHHAEHDDYTRGLRKLRTQRRRPACGVSSRTVPTRTRMLLRRTLPQRAAQFLLGKFPEFWSAGVEPSGRPVWSVPRTE